MKALSLLVGFLTYLSYTSAIILKRHTVPIGFGDKIIDVTCKDRYYPREKIKVWQQALKEFEKHLKENGHEKKLYFVPPTNYYEVPGPYILFSVNMEEKKPDKIDRSWYDHIVTNVKGEIAGVVYVSRKDWKYLGNHKFRPCIMNMDLPNDIKYY
ncbi:hypothetical protein K3495_g9565 [Podosphaera aphanis]|nr:hypothetical protein K3495_g9565 [Podosphaera aphanis]